MAALFGADDQLAKRTSKLVDWSSPARALVWSLRTVAPGGSLRARVAYLKGDPRRGRRHAQVHGGALRPRRRDRAHALPVRGRRRRRSAASTSTGTGAGCRTGCAGEEIPLLARILCLAQTVEIFHAARRPRRAARASRGAAAGAGSTRRWSTRCSRSAATARSGARSSTPTSRAGSRPTWCCAPTTSGSTASPRRSRA